MRDSRWPEVREIFLDALEQPAGARASFLAARCGGDQGLRAEVERLLAAQASPDPRLSRAADLDAAADDFEDASDNLLLTHVGSYRVLRQLGEGGMGAVYEAEQTEPVHRRVALKVVKRGMDTREVVRRFGLERQALALMSHAGIAKVFDAGVTDDGRPYFVMELAAGVPITEYCDRERLPLVARLRLLATLCDAIQHAHHKGVVHRDLKPSNVLVVEDGPSPAPKVIDFGIAKAIGKDLIEQSQHTAVGTLIGTPSYMSPEQATLGSSDVDARTDVYSLAALLYELAVGDPPFPADTLRGSDFLRALQLIRERDAERPSVRFGKLEPQALAAAASLRSASPRDVQRQLREIDWIVMRGLAKDPADRYQTPAALAADIERCLAGLPLDAGPPGRWYRTRKFVARHRFGVAASATVGALVLAFAVTMTVQSVRLERALASADAERTRAEAERTRAEGEQRRAEGVSDFLVDMLRLGDPQGGNRADMTIGEVLDAAARKIPGELGTQPRTKAALMTTIGTVYRERGVYAAAKEQMAAAVELMRTAEPRDEGELGRALNALGELAHDEGNLDEAEGNYREALPLLRAHPHRLTDASVVLNNLAVLAMDRDDAVAAEAPAREALEIRIRTLGPRARDTGQSLRKLGRVMSNQGKWREAEKLIREGIDVESEHATPDNVWRSHALAELNFILRFKGDHRGSEQVTREALQIVRASLGDRHQYTAVHLLNLGRALTSLARYDEADVALKEAWSIYEALFGANHQNSARILSARAEVAMKRGHYAAAERSLRAVLVLDRKLFGDKHRETAAVLSLLGMTVRERGRLDEALALQRESLAIRVAQGADNPDVAPLRRQLAVTLMARNELTAAQAELDEAERIEAKADIADMLPAAFTRSVQGQLLRLQGRPAEAAQALAQALAVQRVALGDNHPEVGRTLAHLGAVECASGLAVSGRDRLGRAVSALEPFSQALPGDLAQARAALGSCTVVATR